MLESLFTKVAILNLEFYQKIDSGAGVVLSIFSKFLREFFFTKHLRATASVVQWFS